MNRLTELLTGKTILITGATGFLGQPLVEKILWLAPEVRRVYVLIRPKRAGGRLLSAQQRLERELFDSSAFERLRAVHGDRLGEFLTTKLIALSGDISCENLGLDEATRERLRDEIDLVINSAAVVSFDAPVDSSLELNVMGAGRLAEFANQCPKAVLIHVSTAYVSGATNESIPETMYHRVVGGDAADPFPRRGFRDPDLDLEHVRRIIQQVMEESRSGAVERGFTEALVKRRRRSRGGKAPRRSEQIETFRKKWIESRLIEEGMKWARQRGWNDTYTYTKALGEQIVVRVREGRPTTIIRPSIIESSLSEPTPGWLDGLRMADPLIAAIGKGRLRSLPLDPEVVIDLVPVDMVVNVLLASLLRPQLRGEPGIYQIATGARNPITLGQLYHLILRYFRKNPMLDKAGKPILVKMLSFPSRAAFRFRHRLKSVPLGTAERTLEKLSAFGSTQRFKRRISAARAAYQKLYYYGEIYEPYLKDRKSVV